MLPDKYNINMENVIVAQLIAVTFIAISTTHTDMPYYQFPLMVLVPCQK